MIKVHLRNSKWVLVTLYFAFRILVQSFASLSLYLFAKFLDAVLISSANI